MFSIGHYSLPNNVVLAPMAGVTDLPFRRLCREHGVGLAVAEMLTSDMGKWHTRKSSLRMDYRGETQPVSVQIAGSEPRQMAVAAAEVVQRGAQIVDINMGCPAKKVCNKAAGSALLKDERLVTEILESVVSAVDVPVTLKIRTGWSPEQRNGVTIAKIAEQSGISALSVHGRTRACRFNGQAEYHTIARIKSAVSIPVIANGDITTPEAAAQVLALTQADAVMIGRGAQGRPWLCGQVADFLCTGSYADEPTAKQKYDVMLGHLRALHDFYGEFMGVRIARKHMGWYFEAMDAVALRKTFNTLERADLQISYLLAARDNADWHTYKNRNLAA